MNQVNLLFKLIINELYKSFFQKKTIGFFGFIIILTLLIAFITAKDDVKGDWRKDMSIQITEVEKQISNEKLKSPIDESYTAKLNRELKELNYRMDNEMPNNVTTPLKFVYICSMNVALVVMLFVVTFSAETIASEYSSGTIRQILVKPVNRWKIFVAKYLSTFIVSITLLIFYLIIATIVGFIVFGGIDATGNEVRMAAGEPIKINMVSHIFWTTLAQLFLILVVCTITYFVATLTRKSVLAIIISFIVLFGGTIIAELLDEFIFYKFFLMPNLMLSAYLPGSVEPFKGATFGFSLSVCLVHAVAFFAGGLSIFSKKDVH